MSIQIVPAKNIILFRRNQYAGIPLKTPSKTLAIDPVDVKTESVQDVDAILITHEHYDHLDPHQLTEIQKTTNCKIIADSASVKRLQHVIPDGKLHETMPWDKTKIGEVTVKTEKCNHPAQAPVTCIINSEDNVKVYHKADSMPFLELALMGEKRKFDTVFCNVGIARGSSPQTSFEIARLTKPQMAVPYHKASAENQIEFAKLVKKRAMAN